MKQKAKKTDIYDGCNQIVRCAGHLDPESVDAGERFNLFLSHAMGRPVIDGKVIPRPSPISLKRK